MGIREASLSLILLCLLCLVILQLLWLDSLQTSAFNGSLTLHLSILHFSRESFIKAFSGMCVQLPSLTFSVQYRSNVSWQSRLETLVLIFEVGEPSLEDWVLSFETLKEFFEDLEQRFRGNDLILKNKTIAMNKAIDERLYSRKLTRCWMYANIFSFCAFSTRHMPFAYLHWSWWQQTIVA